MARLTIRLPGRQRSSYAPLVDEASEPLQWISKTAAQLPSLGVVDTV